MSAHKKHAQIKGIGFAMHGTEIITTDNLGRAIIWSKASGEPLSILELPPYVHESGQEFPRRIESLSISSDTQKMVVGSDDEIFLFDIPTRQEVRSWVDSYRIIFTASFSPTRDLLAISSRYDHTDLWDMEKGKCIQSLIGFPSGPLYDSAIAANNQFIVTTYGTHPYARLWDIQSGKVLHHMTREDFLFVGDIAFSHNSQYLLTSAHTKIACAFLWDTTTGMLVKSFTIDGREAGAIAFAPDDQSFAIASYKEILVVSADNGKVIRRLVGHHNTVMRVVFAENGEQLLSGSNDGTGRLWDIKTGQEIWQVRLPGVT